jgi:sirohydrochlorin cobaltochelatase
MKTDRGLLLFAHGARDPNWALPFEAVACRVRERRGDVAVELAFLEFMRPDLIEAGRRLADAHCTQVEVVPLFLGAGGHVRKDLPALIERLREAHPAVQWRLRAAIGEAELVIDAMSAAALAWLERRDEGAMK